jgi:hypothetical protein
VFVNLRIGGSNSGVPLSRLSTTESGSRPMPRSLPDFRVAFRSNPFRYIDSREGKRWEEGEEGMWEE